MCVFDVFFYCEGVIDFFLLVEVYQCIFDQVVEINEMVMGVYLDIGEEVIMLQQLYDVFEQCLCEGYLVLICFVSVCIGVGVGELLELVE